MENLNETTRKASSICAFKDFYDSARFVLELVEGFNLHFQSLFSTITDIRFTPE